jgi:hypothetical protein
VLLRRVIAVALVFEAGLLLTVAWFFSNLEGDLLIQHPMRDNSSVLPVAALLAYVALLPPVIAYAWRGTLPMSRLPRCLVLAATLAVTLTQLVLPFALDDGLNDSTILWGFCVALGLAYMLNRDVLRPSPATER